MKKSLAITLIVILSLTTIGATAFGVVTSMKCTEKDRFMTANYRHAFSELVTGVSDVDSALKKSLLVTTPSLAGAVCTEIFAKAQTTQMALGVLPFGSTNLEKTTGFINQIGDYAFALSQKASAGEAFTSEERENLNSLSDTISLLAQNLKDIEQGLGSENVGVEAYKSSLESFDENEEEILPQSVGDNMKTFEDEFPEVPSLIYDGPFSEHLKGIKPRMIEGMEEISEAVGRQVVAGFLGMRHERVFPTGERLGDIPSFCYGAEQNKANLSIAVTKQGGVIYEMLSSRAVESTELTAEEALDKARGYLSRWGFKNMKESYYMVSNNVLTANFAYEQNGVTCYSDLIKIGIAMDNGNLQSFEASGYVLSHTTRSIPAVEITEEQAASRVPQGISILGSRLALIPNAGKREILCYEFECEDNKGQKYIVYVNALTGSQEKILILIQDDNGTLTI